MIEAGQQLVIDFICRSDLLSADEIERFAASMKQAFSSQRVAA
jgi:hypothetical protein